MIYLLSRRELIKGGAVIGGFALVGGGALSQVACGPNLQIQFAIARQVAGAISQTLTNLNLPGPAALAVKVVAAIDDIAKAYKAGDFNSALGFLNSIAATGGLIDQILADFSVASNKQIKAFMISLQGALMVISIILEAQKGQPGVAAAVGDESDPRIKTVKRLADESRIDAALKALRQP